MRRVTFSRNFTLSLSRTCQCYCKYCAFATHRAHIHPPAEVERRLDEALKRNAKELLVLTGERPEVNPEVAARSLNTAPLAGVNVTRATAWEIHPVTGLELSDDSLEQQTQLEDPRPVYARSNASNSAP